MFFILSEFVLQAVNWGICFKIDGKRGLRMNFVEKS